MTHEAERPSRFTPTGSSTGIHHDTFREETFSRGARSTPENSKLVVPSFRSNVSQSFTRSRPISFRSTECDVRGDMGLKSQRFQCLQCGKITLLDAESCLVLDEPNSSLGQGLFSAWPFSAKASETYLVPQSGLKTVTLPLSDVRDENSAIPEQADWIDLGGRSPDSLPSPPLTKHSANSPCSEKSTVLASTEQRIHINDTLGCLIFCADVCERMSKYTQADYPLCPKCCEVHLQHLDDEIRTTWKVRDEYKEKLLCAKARAYAQQTNPGEVPSEESVEGLRNQVARLMQDLEECEEEVQHEYEQRIQLEKTRRGLQKRHSRCKRWDVRCHASQTYLFEKKIGLVERMEIKQHELRRLLRTNILNETFYLDTQGPLSTINGLKLMRAPNLHTQQNEINAAWSYYVILLHTLSQNMNLETKTYQLKVNGNWSTINNVTNSNEYELYVGARFWFANSRHEKAIAGFVHCVRELVQAIKQRQPHAGDPPVDMGQEGTGPLMCFTKGGTLTDEMWYVGIKSITMILKWCIYTTMSLAAS